MDDGDAVLLNTEAVRRVHRVTALIALAGIVFYLFFQINKGGPFQDINPFAEDPYDAVGSFAFQAALLIVILTYSRALRLKSDPAEAIKARLILRGNGLVLFAIGITLVADAVAEITGSIPLSYWGNVLLIELGLMVLLTAICIIALVVVFRRIQPAAPPRNLTPADGIDDLWTLVRFPVAHFGKALPLAFVEWVKRFNSDRLFARLPWLNPRIHPWRFACALGLLVGVGLAVAQLQEGFPPSLMIGLLVAGIFISGEFVATLAGFAIFGGYLGLRPSFNLNTRETTSASGGKI
jgi:hypothetical protein